MKQAIILPYKGVHMKQAIILPYTCDQNEPSRPLSKLVSLPDNVKARDQVLKDLFIEVMQPDLEEGDEITVKKGKRDDYGDIVVEGPYDQFLFVTIIKE